MYTLVKEKIQILESDILVFDITFKKIVMIYAIVR